MSTRAPLRVVLLGWGAIGQTVAHQLQQAGESANVDIVAVAARNPATLEAGLPPGAIGITDPSALDGLEVEVILEAAGRDSVEPWGSAAVAAGADFVVSSVSAFADPDLLARLRSMAGCAGVQIHIQPGALGGIDALSAARLAGLDDVEHRIVKPPQAWAGTDAEERCDLTNLSAATVFFTGSAAETADRFPKNANAAMTTALAGIGPDRTQVALVADPEADKNRHEIRADGAFGTFSIVLQNAPLEVNPKTSALAAYGLTRAALNRSSAIAI